MSRSKANSKAKAVGFSSDGVWLWFPKAARRFFVTGWLGLNRLAEQADGMSVATFRN
jgi:hypothetical protein